MKKLFLAALAVLCAAQVASGAADQVRDGESFNTPNCARVWVRRSVDSTGTSAGRRDSAVIICAPNVMPASITVGGMYATDTTSRVLRFDANGNLLTVDNNRDRDYSQMLHPVSSGSLTAAGYIKSSFIQIEEYTSLQLNLNVAFTAADSVNRKNTAIWVVPFAKIGSTDDGLEYFLDTRGRPTGIATDSVLSRMVPGWLFTASNSNLSWAAAGTDSATGYRFERVVYGNIEKWKGMGRVANLFPQQLSNVSSLGASFTFGTGDGLPIKNMFVGFYLFNLSGITISNVSLDAWPKVN